MRSASKLAPPDAAPLRRLTQTLEVNKLSNAFSIKSRFIRDKFTSIGLDSKDLEDENMREVTLYRSDNEPLFIMVTISYDFRDPGWGIYFEVGKGYPEKVEDKVEYQISTISLCDLGIIDAVSTNLPHEIGDSELNEIFGIGIDYCIRFIKGESTEALNARNVRNLKKSIDPLWLTTHNAHLKDDLNERNEELKSIYQKYL